MPSGHDPMGGFCFSFDKRGTRLPEIMLKQKVRSAMTIHLEVSAL
jgi:hypothetical protein